MRLEIFDFSDQVLQYLFGVPKEHGSPGLKEEVVFNASITRLHASFVYNHGLCQLHIQDGHAIDRGRGIGFGSRVYYVVGS